MATELNSIYFQNLPIGAHCRFNTRVSTEIASSPSKVVTILGQLPTEFNKLLAEERAIEDWVKKSVLTDLIRTADRRMDRAFTALKLQTHTQEYSTSAAIAEAAHRVYLMLTSYGKVIRKPYEDQAGDIQSILRQFYSGGAYNADAATLGLSAMISELQTALTLFDQLLKQRDER